jgi:glycogen(starch) synthase
MKVALYSSAFAPATGGVETIARILAEELSEAGNSVVVVTQTPTSDEETSPYVVVRRPSAAQWLAITWRSDVIIHMNMSLKAIWTSAVSRRPTVVVHHGWYSKVGEKGVRSGLKLLVTRAVVNVAVSGAVADAIPAACVVIPNCYDDRVFRRFDEDVREGLVFVGRLVSEKRADLVLQSLAALKARGVETTLTVIGDGPERANLEKLASALAVDDKVRFFGRCDQAMIAGHLNRRKILVMPSIREGFGLVALEAIACGCVVVASSGSGLDDAVGDWAVRTSSDDPGTLADALADVLTDDVRTGRVSAGVSEHLLRHSRATFRQNYLALLRTAVRQ